MKTWTIYRHINKINGKCYVGITCQRWVKCRWGMDGHGYNQRGQKKFWAAICKYGWDNFEHEILETGIATPELANEREKFWIAKFDSFKHGYNGTIGGSGATGHVCDAKTRKKMGEKNVGTKHHTQKHSEETKKYISEIQKGKRHSPRTEFKKGIIPWSALHKGELGKPILQYDENGNFMKEWPNIYTVVQFFGSKSQSCLRQCCLGTRKRYKGCLWRHKDTSGEVPLKIEPPILIDVRVPVMQFDLEGNFIAEYESTIEASRQTGVNRSGIKKCCDGTYRQGGGYIWKWKKEDNK